MNPSVEKIAELRVEIRALADVNHPHPDWPGPAPVRGTPDYEALKFSLADDYFDPIVWNERNGRLVSGHKRLPIMLDLGFTHAPVVIKDYDEETHRAKILAANTHAGDPDEGRLNQLIAAIKRAGTDPLLAMLKAPPSKKTDLREIIVKAPPQMAWTLVGVPLHEFASVQNLLDSLPASAIVETSASDWKPC